MAYQSKHTGSNIDNAVTEHSEINQDIVDINSQISQLNILINNLNTSISNLQSKDTSLTNSINSINTNITNLQTTVNNLGMTTSSQYVRFNNGLQICWGRMSYPQLGANSTGHVAVTLPAAFKDTNYQVATTMEVDAGNSWHTGIYAVQKGPTYMNVYTRNGATSQLSSTKLKTNISFSILTNAA